jgi:cytochrome c oxidase subunit 1/cytochrome c oxidase subunit I+III
MLLRSAHRKLGLHHVVVAQISFWTTFVGTALTFFPMHIVGLVGMPRREYTYPSGHGWGGWAMAESIGSYLLAVGLILIVVNLAVSLRRGAPAGADPWKAETLEWSTTSPPPHYNYAVIPKVTSAYPMWDREDRDDDRRRLDAGIQVLEEGHETPASTVLDGEYDEILEMPSESWAPISLALMLLVTFSLLLLEHWVAAGVLGGLAGLVLVGWHSKEPQAA